VVAKLDFICLFKSSGDQAASTIGLNDLIQKADGDIFNISEAIMIDFV
jgi:hypothetical protein